MVLMFLLSFTGLLACADLAAGLCAHHGRFLGSRFVARAEDLAGTGVVGALRKARCGDRWLLYDLRSDLKELLSSILIQYLSMKSYLFVYFCQMVTVLVVSTP